jgi:hypothetical protein
MPALTNLHHVSLIPEALTHTLVTLKTFLVTAGTHQQTPQTTQFRAQQWLAANMAHVGHAIAMRM